MIVEEIIRAARGHLNQSEFARKMKRNQSDISKYERGETNPPLEFINQCIRILDKNELNETTAHALAQKIETRLAGKNHEALRAAISEILNAAIK